MTDPFASLQPLDLDALSALDCSDLEQPFTDTPDFSPSENPEIDPAIRLDGDRRHVRTPTRRLFVDYRSNPEAYRHLSPLPAPGESLHGVISGKYALFDLIPAILETSGKRIDELYLTSLGFSKQNGSDLAQMLDDRFIGKCSLVCSYYFKSTSTDIYDAVIPPLLARGVRVLSMRNHSKMILARLDDGTCFSCESSANLRSCVNIEQFVMTNDETLYQFHRAWIDELFARRDEGKRDHQRE